MIQREDPIDLALSAISKIGPLSPSELTGLIPHFSKRHAHQMLSAGQVKVVERDDSTTALAVTPLGRVVVGAPAEAPTLARARVPNFTEDYDPVELKPFSARAGANDHEKFPSRIGDVRVFRRKS